MSDYKLRLVDPGPKRITLIKCLRAAFGLGLKEAKEMSETDNALLGIFFTYEEAESTKMLIETSGATCIITQPCMGIVVRRLG